MEIRSRHGRVVTRVKSDEKLRRGVIALSHGWGGLARENTPGVNVNCLTSAAEGAEAINAMPRMSAVPVAVGKPGG